MTQNKDYKQLIIARKDLNMTPGKLAAQVSHASMAFLTNQIKKEAYQSIENDNYMVLPCIESIEGKLYAKLYIHPELMKFSQKGFNEGKEYIYLKKVPDSNNNWEECSKEDIKIQYKAKLIFNQELYEKWIMGSFTKVVCGARNLNQLMRVTKVAADLDLKEGVDYFIIKDNCLTELNPEEVDENGVGRTTTCIGFAPLPADITSQLSKKYQLY